MKTNRLMHGSAVAMAAAVTGMVVAQVQVNRAVDGATFDGYDFGQVVATMETSVNPLQREMDLSFRVFVDSVHDAEKMLDEGRTQEAVQKASSAIQSVLAVREQVLAPMWSGQETG